MLLPLPVKRARSAFRVESDLGCTGPLSDGDSLRSSAVMWHHMQQCLPEGIVMDSYCKLLCVLQFLLLPLAPDKP